MFGIPLELYTDIYQYIILLIVVLAFVHTITNHGHDNKSLLYNKIFGFVLLAIVTAYLGFRPISYVFGDMGTYARHFEYYAKGATYNNDKDIVWFQFMVICSRIMSAEAFFFLCAVLYIIPPYIAINKWFPKYNFIALLIYVGSGTFWAYGSNGIRAGIAASLFIFGLQFRRSILLLYVIIIASTFVHKSMWLPVLAISVTFIVNKPKWFIYAWFISIFMSLAMGGFWENFFAGIGFADERFSTYLTNTEYQDRFSHSGFRWDFLVYGAIPIFIGGIAILRYGFKDKFYYQLYNTYLISNAFWILVIRASFSNRFAFLSWFLMPLVIIYPVLKYKMFKNQYALVGLLLFLFCTLTRAIYFLTH